MVTAGHGPVSLYPSGQPGAAQDAASPSPIEKLPRHLTCVHSTTPHTKGALTLLETRWLSQIGGWELLASSGWWPRMLLSTQKNASAQLSTSQQWSCPYTPPDTRWARSSPRLQPPPTTHPGSTSADMVSQAQDPIGRHTCPCPSSRTVTQFHPYPPCFGAKPTSLMTWSDKHEPSQALSGTVLIHKPADQPQSYRLRRRH